MRLLTLIKGLDALGPQPSLLAIADLLKQTRLQAEDITDYVQPNPRQYQRATIVSCPSYELLVMTWQPGQSSVPHDHTGSICAMQVIQGTAIESEFTIGEDGFVQLEFETAIEAGQVTAGQDAGIHAIRNGSATDVLITLHVYAPPLADFRRFVARPPAAVEHMAAPDTIAIIGGGFSGTMTAANLLKLNAAACVALIERCGSIGEGVAYGTRDDAHRLNVPAARMSAWPDQPSHFLEWAQRQCPGTQPGDFLPRGLYADYLRETLRTAKAQSATRLEIHLDDARRVTRHPDGGWLVNLSRGASVRARAVVLAIGHRAPNDPLKHVWQGPRERFIPDPWKPLVLDAIEPNESVAILGSGLTAVDTVLSLTRTPRTAPIVLLSRSGLMPHAHTPVPVATANLTAWLEKLLQQPITAVKFAKALRQYLRTHPDTIPDWRSLVDGLRPHTAAIWQHLPVPERRRFLNRLRPFWEVHRHRMAPDIAERIRQLLADRTIELVPCNITRALGASDRVVLDIRIRGAAAAQPRSFDWVINCTGPAPSNSADANPVIGSLLVHDWVSRDELNLGLRTTADGRAIAAAGQPVADLFVVGTLRKPELWESTAVPELRQQAAHVARLLCHKPTAS